MAAPHVAGAAVILMSNGYSHTEARARLVETAEDIDLGDTEQGSGLVDVNAAVSTTSEDIITLDGYEDQDEIAEYTFLVDGSVEKSTEYGGTINSSDEIHGSVVTGRTRKQADSYRIDGEIVAFSAAGPIDVFLNGEKIDPSQFDDTILTLDGDETQEVIAEYTFAVDGDVEKSTRYDGTINSSDEIHGSVVTGRTRKQADSFNFEGRITAFSAAGPIDVFLNGEKIDPSQFDDTILTLDGDETQDEVAEYEFEYVGNIEKSTRYGGTINSSDEIHDGYVTGKTRKQPDSFRFEGRITSFSVDGPVDVFLNGTFVGSTAPV